MKNRIKINKRIGNILSKYSWITNDNKARRKIKKIVSSILISEKKKSNIEDYKVTMDQSNNPPMVVTLNSGVLEVCIRQSGNWYVNTFTIAPTSSHRGNKSYQRKNSINKIFES
jgi:hypothetical protein